MPSNALNEARELLEGRLAELNEERREIERLLGGLGGKAPARKAGGRRPGRPRGSSTKTKKSTPAKRRRRRGGTRADQAVSLVEKSPGISASDIAKEMKIKPNYLYRVLSDLEKEGRVKKQGRAYHPGGSGGGDAK